MCTFNRKLNYNKNAHTIKSTQSYNFATRSLTELTLIHSKWYCFDFNLNKYLKIVPINIADILFARGLANWIMDDGYWKKTHNTVVLCTHSFKESEVDLLIAALNSNFGLIASHNKQITKDKIYSLIVFSGKSNNINKLRDLV